MEKSTQEALELIHRGGHILYREVGRICEKHHIRYFLEGGNLIGAVREHGDLPWDDDTDIAMTRKDFEVFRKVVREELKPGFLYVEPDELDGAFFDFVPRVMIENSSLRKDSPEEQYYGKGINNHICADIFVLDDVSDNALRHRITHALLVLIYGLGMGKRYKLDLSEYHGLAKAAVAVLSFIGKLFSAKTLVRWYDRTAQRESGQNKNKHGLFFHNYLIQMIGKVFDASWYESSVNLRVGSEDFPAPVGYDGVLRTLYGDYMTPPPSNERVQVHIQPEYVRLWYEEDK